MTADLCGFSLALAPNEACYVPVAHKSGDGIGLFAADNAPDQLKPKDAVAELKKLLEDESILKIGQNLKFDKLMFAQHGITLRRLRRHHADVLRARCRPHGPRHGFAVGHLPRPHADQL